MEYVAADGTRQRPIMIHRAIFGSLERFFGILIENYAGDFPLWLAPVQIRLLVVSDAQRPYALEVLAQLQQQGFRAEIDQTGERLGKQIRQSALEKFRWSPWWVKKKSKPRPSIFELGIQKSRSY